MKNQNLIRKIAWSLNKTTGISFDELYSEACLAYLEAEMTYDATRGAEFTTYAYSFVRNRLVSFVRKEKTEIHTIEIADLGPRQFSKLQNSIPEFEEHSFSSDMKEIISVVLGSPVDFFNISPRPARGMIRKELHKNGWSQKKINSAFIKLTAIIKEAEYGSLIIHTQQ